MHDNSADRPAEQRQGAAREAAYAVAARIQDEGTVLLRNTGALPLAAGSEVMPFGHAYLSPIYGQLTAGGSAKWSVGPVTPEEGLAGFAINTAVADAMAAAGEVALLLEAEGAAPAGLVSGELAVDAILHYGHPSERGMARLSAILSGEVSPSGRTVDTWPADFTADPSYVSIGTHTYTNMPVTSGSYTDGGEFMCAARSVTRRPALSRTARWPRTPALPTRRPPTAFSRARTT